MGMRDDELGYWSLGEINNELNNNSKCCSIFRQFNWFPNQPT